MIQETNMDPVSPEHNSTESRIAKVGTSLSDALRAVLAALPNSPMRAVELSSFLGIDKTLSVRLVGALKKQDPLAVCHSVPGPRGLRNLLSVSRGRGVPEKLIAKGETAVSRFEQIVRELGGSRSAFNTIISSLLPDVRERIERSNKKAAFDAMSNLLGYQVGTSFIACMIQPSEAGVTCDSVCFTGKVAMRHLTPRVARMIWAQKCTVPSWDAPAVSGNLDRTPVGTDQVPVIKEFCTQPLPSFKLYQHGGSNYIAVAGDEVPSCEPVNLFIGSYTPGTFLRYRTRECGTEFVSLTPAEPAKVAFVDVFLHEDVWSDVAPRLEVYRTGPRGNLDEPDERSFDRIDMLESVRLLGNGTDRIHTNDVENYASMVRRVFERVGWNGDRFRVFRARVEFPLLHCQIMLKFELPERERQ